MLITRKSAVTGTERTFDLAITPEQIAAYQNGALVQDAFPQLTPAQREFFLTGITDEEWDEHIRIDDDEDEIEDEPAF